MVNLLSEPDNNDNNKDELYDSEICADLKTMLFDARLTIEQQKTKINQLYQSFYDLKKERKTGKLVISVDTLLNELMFYRAAGIKYAYLKYADDNFINIEELEDELQIKNETQQLNTNIY